MSIVVTGATGQLGRLVVQALVQRGVPAEQIIATGRRTQALPDLADRGVVVRRADFNDQASLPEAFAGADKLLLVSGSEAGQRVRQHANAINAAKAAGVGFLAYTSGVRANTSTLLVMKDHRATEGLLAEAGVPHARAVQLLVSGELHRPAAGLPGAWHRRRGRRRQGERGHAR